MELELSFVVLSSVLGVIGGCSASRFPASGMVALALGLVPAAGLWLSIAFGWHPLAWLGPSLICAGPPLAFGVTVHALRRATDRWVTYLALVLSGLELAVWPFFCASLVMMT